MLTCHTQTLSLWGWRPSQSRTDNTRLLEVGFRGGGNFQLTSLTTEAQWDTLHKLTQWSLKKGLKRCSLTPSLRTQTDLSCNSHRNGLKFPAAALRQPVTGSIFSHIA